MSCAPRIRLDVERQESDLAAYLGAEYDRNKLVGHQAEIDREVAVHGGDEAAFYRSSNAYLYDLTVFAMSATKVPYLETICDLVPSGSRLLDYGCGIGADGLLLLDAGYQVEFADFDNPSTAFLKWRLRDRGLSAPVHDLDGEVPGGYAAAYAFDVIEHVKDPFGFLTELEQRAGLVVVNLLDYDPNEQQLHYELPIDELLGYVADRDLVHYAVHHGSSRLVAYRPEPVSAIRRRLNRARLRRRGTVI